MSEITKIPLQTSIVPYIKIRIFTSPGIHQQRSSSNNLPTEPFKVSSLTLVWITYIIIIVIPTAVAVTYFLYRKGII